MGVGQGAVGVLKMKIKDYNEKTTKFKKEINWIFDSYYLGEALVEFVVLIDFDFFGGSCPNGFSIINQVPIPCGLLNLKLS